MGALFFIVILSVPFHFIWNALAPTYFFFLPPVYQQIPFFDCVGLFAIAAILRTIVFPVRKPMIKKFKWNRQDGFHRTEKYVNR